MIQTFWSKYKVVIFGIASAILTAIAPLTLAPSHEWNIKALIVAAIVAGSSFYGKEARGKNWTAGGQVAAMLIVIASSYQQDFDLGRMILAALFSFFSIPLSPVKPAEYEHTPTIAQAKVEAEAIKIENETGQ